mgnify:CR=1 FL=1
MKKKLFIFFTFILAAVTGYAQVTYQFSFQLPQAGSSMSCKAFFINYSDGTAQTRIRFNAPLNTDSTLVDLKAEDVSEKMTGCSDMMLFYKLQKTQLLFGNDNGITLPAYFCFRKNGQTGLFEPFGFSVGTDDCKAPITPFTSVDYLDKKDLTDPLLLTYFNNREKFYNSLYASTRDVISVDRNLTMHLLVVANTFDQNIGNACAKDMHRAIKFFQDLRDFLGIRFEYDTIAGKRYNLTEVNKAIDKLGAAGPNDIIVFYYSGHGFRQKDDNRRPPYIDLRPNYDENPNNLNSKSLADVFQTISGMKARFKLVLSDCCNDMSKTYSVKAKPPSATKGFSLSGSFRNGADLFLNSQRMSILATGANPGQRSICNDDFGGFFSYNFLNAIEGQLSFLNSNASWDKITEEALMKTRKMSLRVECPAEGNPNGRCNQIPYFEKESR